LFAEEIAEVLSDTPLPGGTSVAVRFGTLILSGDDDAPMEDVIAQIIGDLRMDGRVRGAIARAPEPEWDSRPRFFPLVSVESHQGIAHDEVVIRGSDYFLGYEWSNPIAIKVHVPASDQRRVFPDDWVAEDYCVLWNGVTVLVGWIQPTGKKVAYSGGHVVLDILDRDCGEEARQRDPRPSLFP
jgi:hypothetical protein